MGTPFIMETPWRQTIVRFLFHNCYCKCCKINIFLYFPNYTSCLKNFVLFLILYFCFSIMNRGSPASLSFFLGSFYSHMRKLTHHLCIDKANISVSSRRSMIIYMNFWLSRMEFLQIHLLLSIGQNFLITCIYRTNFNMFFYNIRMIICFSFEIVLSRYTNCVGCCAMVIYILLAFF